jgi:cobalt-zinc-cadmium efflux system membrane fusion protein
MEIGSIEKAAFFSKVRATGILDVPPSRRAELNVYFGGYVKEVDLLPGDAVKKGDVLFILEDPVYLEIQSEFLQSRDALKYLKNDFERQRALRADSISSEKKYLKSEEEYQSALSRYESLREKVKLLNIDPDRLNASSISSLRKVKAPISGTVSEMHLKLGSYVKPSEKAICIINTEHLHVELKVFEKDLKAIKEGQTILFSLQNDSKRTYTAEVHLINRQIDPEERSLQLHGHLPEDSTYEDLYPGMYVEAQILTASDTLPAIASQAVVEKNGRYFAALVKAENGDQIVIEEIEILPIKMNDEYVAIKNISDIPENAKFILKGAFNLIQE